VLRAFLLAVAAACAFVFASPAVATILPQKGIAGVSIGMSQGKVRSVLGKPSSVKRGSNDFGKYMIYRYPGLRVSFQGNASVTDMSTTRKSERTARGVGVGSTVTKLKAGVKGLTCKTESGFRHCYLGKFLAGRRVTDFVVKRGKVSRVDVGVVID
jgi:hypothetical protein